MSYLLMYVILLVTVNKCFSTSNLTCYQCEKSTTEECSTTDLKPCASTFDRCVLRVKRTAHDGLVIRRDCGLAPCNFNDEMTTKGLGMTCDRSKDTYDCYFCCKENGCNKSSATRSITSTNFFGSVFQFWTCWTIYIIINEHIYISIF